VKLVPVSLEISLQETGVVGPPDNEMLVYENCFTQAVEEGTGCMMGAVF
jgi:hypothetical protein